MNVGSNHDQLTADNAAHWELLHRLADGQDQMIALLRNQNRSAKMIAVAEDVAAPTVETDFPLPGTDRLLLPRSAAGGLVTVKASPAITFLRPPSHGRVGGLIVNEGTKPVRIFLDNLETVSSPAGSGVGVLTLAAEGGSWNFKVSDAIWAGSLCATAVGGESTLDIVEL